MPLRYLYVDMNSFFASVEQQMRPELRGRPVAVVPVLADTTCCIAASYEAKAHGVRTGTRVGDARRLCPGLQVVEARPPLYVATHHRLIQAVESCLPVAAVCSIDELVCRLLGDEQQPEQALHRAARIRAAVRRDLGPYVRCSIGLGPNQLLAKVATDMQKPDGITMIRSEELPARLHALQLTDFPGIGPRMEQRLIRSGVATVEQLCRLSAAELGDIWKSRLLGQMWWRHLRGYDVPAAPTRRRTLGHSHVLAPSCRSAAAARAVLLRLLEKAAARLRFIGYWAGSLGVAVDFLNGGRWVQQRRIGLCQDTPTLIRAARQMWQHPPAGTPLRVGVVLSDLVQDRNAAGPLFQEDKKLLALSRAMDDINQKYGASSIYFGGTHGVRGQAPTRIAFTQIPNLDLADA